MIVKIKKVSKLVSWGAKDHKSKKLMPMYENCVDKLVPSMDILTGEIRTGLSPKDQTEFEETLEMEKGSLLKSGSFWKSFSISIPGEGLTLNTMNPVDLLKYKVLVADPTVCESLTELRTHATAEYLMTSEDAEAKVSNKKRNVRIEASVVFSKLTQDEVVNALLMFGQYAGNVDPEVARDRLGVILEENPNKFMLTVGDKLFKDKVWMMKLIKEGVIKKHGVGNGTNQPLYFEDIKLGMGLEESIAFIKAKENSAVAQGLKKALKA